MIAYHWTIEHYGRDLRLFLAPLAKAPEAVSWRDIEVFIQRQRQAPLAATTITCRLNALKHVFDSLAMEAQRLASHPVTPSPVLRWGRPLPTHLAQDQVRTLFAQITHPLERALGLLMLRCGLRVSAVTRLRLGDMDWEQHALRMAQGKGRKDRIISLAADALAALRTCLAGRPAVVPDGLVCWHQKRPHRALSSKGMQKKIKRYAKAAGITARCHSLRQTFASNL